MSVLSYAIYILPSLLKGLAVTLELFALTICLALPLGLPIALGSLSKSCLTRIFCKSYVWLFRGTPLMLQLFFVYYGLGNIGNRTNTRWLILNRFPAALLTFVLNYAAYLAEIYRAGIQSIDTGQYEASKALGLTRWQTMRQVIIPQALKNILPPVCNETITLVKDTSTATVIAVPELLKAARDSSNRDVNTTSYFIAAVIYLILTFVFSLIYRRLDRFLSKQNDG